MISLIFSLPAFYVIARVVWPLPWPLAVKLGVAAVLLVASQYHRWSRLSSGSVFAPEFPRPLVILFNWLIGATILLAVIEIPLDLASLVSSISPEGTWAISDTARYAAALGAMLLAAIAVRQATRVPQRKDVEIVVENLSPAFDGYTILQLTDLHISRMFPERWARAVVDRADSVGADLVAVTGDFIDGSLAMRRADVEPLRALRAKDGVWAIPGNHEYFFHHDEWMRYFAEMGIHVLANAHGIVRRGDSALVLAGVTDRSAPATGHPGPDLDRALAGAPPGIPIVLLDHQPKNAPQAAARGVALQLSGHTHGGMILGLDRLVARGNGGFVSGAYEIGGMTLYVSNGTGLWPGFALRLGRPPEMTRFILKPAQRRTPA